MRVSRLTVVLIFQFLASFVLGQSPELNFAHNFNLFQSENEDDYITNLEYHDGKLFLSGVFYGIMNPSMNGSSMQEIGNSNLGTGFFATYNSEGAVDGFEILGNEVSWVVPDDQGNLLVGGWFFEDIDLDLTGENPILIEADSGSFFFCKYQANSIADWVSICNSIIWEPKLAGENYLASSSFNNNFEFSSDNSNTFLSFEQFTSYGVVYRVSPMGSIMGYNVIESGSSNFGTTSYSALLNEGAMCGNIEDSGFINWIGTPNVYIDSNGKAAFVSTFNNSNTTTSWLILDAIGEWQPSVCHFTDVMFDDSGNLYILGLAQQAQYELLINDTFVSILDVEAESEALLIKLSVDKELLWIKRMPTDNFPRNLNMYVDHNEFINICGRFNSFLEFEGSSTLLNGTSESGFIARWTPEGELVWAHTISDGGANSINDICITPQNEMYIGGWFTTFSTDFDFTENGSFDLGVASGEDAFIAKYTIANPTPDVFVEQGWQTTEVTEGGNSDVIYVRLSHAPEAPVQVTATPNSQLDIGNGPGVAITLNFAADGTAVSQQLITVIAFDDNAVESLHTGLISFTISSSDAQFNGLTENAISVSITDNDIVSVNELDNTLFTISPNPATSELLASFALHQSNTWMQIYDEAGKLVMSEQATAPQCRLDISSLAAGTYTISIQSPNQKHTKVFVKK